MSKLWLAAVGAIVGWLGGNQQGLASDPNWSGLYGGIHLGYAAAPDRDHAILAQDGPVVYQNLGVLPKSLASGGDGFLGGVHLGQNWQTGPIVFGLEADISGATAEESGSYVDNTTFGFTSVTTEIKSRLNWLATLRARIGVEPIRGLMIFGTGGVAVGGTESRLSTTVASGGFSNAGFFCQAPVLGGWMY